MTAVVARVLPLVLRWAGVAYVVVGVLSFDGSATERVALGVALLLLSERVPNREGRTP